MASPLLSKRVCYAILRSLCSKRGKMHGQAVVQCFERQKVTISLAGVTTVYTFADVVDVAGYDARGMIDDFFPRYPYKTTRNSWKHFKTWLTDSTGQIYQEFCMEWIDLAQLYLRKCSVCRSRACKSTTEELVQVFGTFRPYFIGERPGYMYRDDDHVRLEAELYPVAGGLVIEGAGPVVKEEMMDAPPGFPWLVNHFKLGEPSGTKEVVMSDVSSAGKQIVTYSSGANGETGDAEEMSAVCARGDPMLLDPAVLSLLADSLRFFSHV